MPDVLLIACAFAAGFAVVRVLAWRKVHRQRSDDALVIHPPRRFVDADGRSDFRPELREATERRRAREQRV